MCRCTPSTAVLLYDLALRRGRQVEGAYSRKGRQVARMQGDRRSVNSAVDELEVADLDAGTEGRTFRKAVSAHIAGAQIDAAMSLNSVSKPPIWRTGGGGRGSARALGRQTRTHGSV